MTPLELFEENKFIPTRLAIHYARLVPLEQEELESEGRVQLWECAVTYNKSLGIPFRFWAHKMINWSMQQMITRSYKSKEVNSRCFPPESLMFSKSTADVENICEQRELIAKAKQNRFLWRKAIGYHAVAQAKVENVSQVSISKYIRKARQSLLEEFGG